MNKKWLIGGIVVAVIGAIVLVAVLVKGDGEPDGWIAKKYRKLSLDTYSASKAPQQVAEEIAKKFKPIDRVNALGLAAGTSVPAVPMTSAGGGVPAAAPIAVAGAAQQGGIFLQYPKTVVGVLPDGAGSRITVDGPDRGYRRYNSYVGSHWTSPGSGGWNRNGTASFRGGGPGSGK
ncbi:DUF4247 domain-containing protein [Spirillospora sp. NPDC047279]|uniref:DUF4247 domain-containing protein n=1 Tax=Spirillospora sp. NPDC047279 TaxID=3155478 RepID=UPI0034106BF0